jgi:hypothetical protein
MLHAARTQDKRIFFEDSVGENFKRVLIRHVEFKGCFMLHVARTQDKRIFFEDSTGENFKLVMIRHVECESARASRPWTVMSK